MHNPDSQPGQLQDRVICMVPNRGQYRSRAYLSGRIRGETKACVSETFYDEHP